MPRANHVRLVAYVPPEFFRSLKHECVDRGMTLGELVQEAFYARPVLMQNVIAQRDRTKKGSPNGR